MGKTNLLHTRTANFLELVGNGRIYRVPPFQRDYSWEEEQWEDLWNDIAELTGHPEEQHYMGAIVVESQSDREFLIIDGQQRLATLTILALAVIAKLRRMAEAGIDSAANLERAGGLRSRFIGEKDPASLVESSKLFLNHTDDAFFQDYLVQLRPARNPRGLPKSNRLLWESFTYFSTKLDAAEQRSAWFAELLAETVGRQLHFILITVEDELSAYTVFETLNARGLELSATDLLKNYLFSKLRVAADLVALQRRWRALLTTVRQERFPEFLRYHLACEVPRVRTERLFKLVRERVKDAAQVFALMEALERRAELFSAISDPTHGYWIDNPDCRAPIVELNLFRVRQMMPLLFVAWEQYQPKDFARLLRVIAVISFRYSIVSGLNPNALEPVYHEAARALAGKQPPRLKAIFQILRPIYVDDGKFEEDFARFSVETTGQRKKLAKYILSRLESVISQRGCDPETDPATIEHILPENPGADWAEVFPPEHWEPAVYRLGNLTLLEPAANRRAGNADLATKLDEYARSPYTLSRELASREIEAWTPAAVDLRQREMAKIAVGAWRVDLEP